MERLRYVVLRHEGVAEPHFDLMIESAAGGALRTWRSPTWPIVGEVAMTELGAHRREYLEYEGPLTNNRGYVKRVAAGGCEVRWLDDAHCVVVLEARLELRLRRGDDAKWLVIRDTAADRPS